MELESTELRDLRLQYRDELNRLKRGEAVRVALVVLFVINSVFVALDWWAFPEQFAGFLASRLALNALVGILFFRTSYANPVAAEMLGCLGAGAMLLTVIYGTGGPSSEYYAGLLLLFFAIPVLVTISARQCALIVTVLFAGFSVPAPMVAGIGELKVVVVHSLFLLGAGFASVTASGLLDRGRFTDFIRRREIERARDELQELDQAKSRFTANVHHELRTPLTLMLAPLDSMLAGDFGELAEIQRTYLQTMRVNGLRLLKLINNLLDLAKAESGSVKLHRRPLEAGRFVSEVVSGARPMAERKSVALTVTGMDSLPRIHADPEALEKVVVNLLGNALKFTPSGGRIEVRGEAQGDGIHLAVADSGIGIPADHLERIFDRFAQVDASATRAHEGTGIGLSLAKELVELHGGRIWAESPGPGQGATLHVVLPRGQADEGLEEEVLQTSAGEPVALARSMGALEAELGLEDRSGTDYRLAELERTVVRQQDAGDSEAAPAAALAPAVPADAPEIVVAEDNPEMRRLLSFLVGREYRVRAARNGREALEMVRERAPDLVLTDVMMPELSGTDLCRAIKEDPLLRPIPVVLVTSKAEREMKIEGLELGADDYVTKPFHPRELLARVRSLVRLRGLQSTLARRNEELETALADLQEFEVQLVRAERLAAVGELAAGVAHEVNNPVNFAVNALGALRDHVARVRRVAEELAGLDLEDPTKLRQQLDGLQSGDGVAGLAEVAGELGELVEIASEGLHRTHRLVGELRDFASPGHGPHAPCDVARGLRSTVQLIGHALQRAGVRVEVTLPASLPEVRGDAAALNQVFLNLLKNAVEALETRGGTIRVGAAATLEGVQVEIQDDGPGLPEEVRRHLFQPFVTTKDPGRGTGLGLSMCHRIVSEHGGRIDVRSEEGAGTSFTITLPLEGRDAA